MANLKTGIRIIPFSLLFLFPVTKSWSQAQAKKIDYCQLYGRVFIETQAKALANAIVFIETSESFADLSVYKQSSAFFANHSGQWCIVPDRNLADFIIYIETVKAFANFSIYYTDQEAFAGCKQ